MVLAHSGAYRRGPRARPAGEIVDETRDMSDAVDVVIAGHTHSHLNTRVPNRDGGGRQAGDRGEVARHRLRPRADDDRPRQRRRDRQDAGHAAHLGRRRSRPDAADRPRSCPPTHAGSRRSRTAWWAAPGARCCATAPAPSRAASIAVAARAQRRLAKADIAVVNEGNARATSTPGPITYAELFGPPPTSTRCCGWS